MRIKQWMSTLIFFIPALSAGIGVHSIQEFVVALFLFPIAFTAAAIIFYSQSEFSKRILKSF